MSVWFNVFRHCPFYHTTHSKTKTNTFMEDNYIRYNHTYYENTMSIQKISSFFDSYFSGYTHSYQIHKSISLMFCFSQMEWMLVVKVWLKIIFLSFIKVIFYLLIEKYDNTTYEIFSSSMLPGCRIGFVCHNWRKKILRHCK